jgi:xanthosine utilization system XapX-like protein
MDVIQNIRDIILIIVGIVWSIIYLGIFAVTAIAGVLVVRYLGRAQQLIEEQGRPLLDSARWAVDSARARTASLPHYAGAEGAPREEVPPRAVRPQTQLKLSLPFFRRKKPWYQRLLGQ